MNSMPTHGDTFAKPTAGGGVTDGKPDVYGSMKIGRRVLETPSRTIAIGNIATVSVGTLVKQPNATLLLAGVGAILAALSMGLGTSDFRGSYVLNPVPVTILIAGIASLIVYFLPADKPHYLTISTSDGTRTHFTGRDPEVLEDVRQILSEKINKADQAAVFNVNFEKGVIETLNAGSLDVAALVQGDNNQVAAHSPGARIGTVEKAYHAENSPGAQVGEGNVAAATATHTTTVSTIDYAAHLPTIDEWRQFYGRHPEGRMVDQRLAELERLMASGTPTEPARTRLRDVATDLSMILQGYPAMVQVFRDIIRTAGF